MNWNKIKNKPITWGAYLKFNTYLALITIFMMGLLFVAAAITSYIDKVMLYVRVFNCYMDKLKMIRIIRA